MIRAHSQVANLRMQEKVSECLREALASEVKRCTAAALHQSWTPEEALVDEAFPWMENLIKMLEVGCYSVPSMTWMCARKPEGPALARHPKALVPCVPSTAMFASGLIHNRTIAVRCTRSL
jgi:hypothetical protein